MSRHTVTKAGLGGRENDGEVREARALRKGSTIKTDRRRPDFGW